MYVVLDAGINGEVERQLGVLFGAGGFGGNLSSLSRLSGRGRDFFPLWLLGWAVLGVWGCFLFGSGRGLQIPGSLAGRWQIRRSNRGRDGFAHGLLRLGRLAVLGVLCSLLLCQECLVVLRGEGEEMVVADSLAFGVDDDRVDAMEHHVCLDCREILLVKGRHGTLLAFDFRPHDLRGRRDFLGEPFRVLSERLVHEFFRAVVTHPDEDHFRRMVLLRFRVYFGEREDLAGLAAQ